MATTREAGIKLTIKKAGFTSGIKGLGKDANDAGKRIAQNLSQPIFPALKKSSQDGFRDFVTQASKAGRVASASIGTSIASAASAGWAGAQKQMKGMLGDFGGQMKNLATLGGAFAVGSFLKDAIGRTHEFMNLAFEINKVPGNNVDWRNLETSITNVGHAAGQTGDAMATAFKVIFEATGDLDYSKSVLEGVATASTATGISTEQLGNVAQLAYRKFGISIKDSNEAIAAFIEKVGVGGASIDKLALDFDTLATEASQAGMAGTHGISQLLGMMLALDSALSDKSKPGMIQFFRILKDGTPQMKAFEKAGVKFTAGSSAIEKLRTILSSEKGRAAAQVMFTADARVVYDELAKPFINVYDEAKKGHKKTKEATDAGLKMFDTAMAKMGQSSMTYSNLQDEAADRMKKDPAVIMRLAFDKVARAFDNERMLNSLDRLSVLLPGLADKFTRLLEFVFNHPLLSAGGFIGGKMGIGFAQGAIQNAGSQIGTTMAAKLAAEAPTTGAKMGLAFKGAAIAAAAYIGYEIGKYAINKFTESKNKAEEGAIVGEAQAAAAAGSKSLKFKEETLVGLRAKIAQQKAEKNMFWSQAGEYGAAAADWTARTTGVMDRGDKGRMDTRADAIAKLEAAERQLVASIEKQKAAKDGEAETTKRANGEMSRVHENLGRLARGTKDAADAMDRLKKTAGGRGGPPGPLPNTPGHAGP